MKSILSAILGAGAAYAALAWRRQPAEPTGYGVTFGRKPARTLWLFKKDNKAWVFPWAKCFWAQYEPDVRLDEDGYPLGRHKARELEQIQLSFMDGSADCVVTVHGRNLGIVMEAIADFRLEGLAEQPTTMLAVEAKGTKRVPVILAVRVETIS